MLLRNLTVLLLWMTTCFASAQTEIVRLDVARGGSMYMDFNSYTKINDGITYANWTTFRVRVEILDAGSNPVAGVNWTFDVTRIGGDPIPGDVEPPLPADVLFIRAVYNGSTTVDTGIIPISGTTNLFTILAASADSNQIDHTIDVSYYVGVTADGCTTVAGEEADFYFQDLRFDLIVDWP
jgi:hypothetical protein